MIKFLIRFGKHLYKIVKGKKFQNSFLVLASFGILMFSFPVNAETDAERIDRCYRGGGSWTGTTCINENSILKAYERNKEDSEELTGVKNTENMQKYGMNLMGTMVTIFNTSIIGKESMTGNNGTAVNTTKSYDSVGDYITSRGAINVIDDSVQSMLYTPPQFNVPEHMAENWVPGYKTEDFSTIANESREELIQDACGDDQNCINKLESLDNLSINELRQIADSLEEAPTQQSFNESESESESENTTKSDPISPSTGYGYLKALGVNTYWNKSVTIAYVLFIIVLIIAGFMIMFRTKIGGQTAVTIYNTIPNIAMNLLLVTFSFAIVGFILDLSVLLSRFVVSFMGLEKVRRVEGLFGLFTTTSTATTAGGAALGIGGAVTAAFVSPVGWIATALGGIIALPLLIILLTATVKVYITLLKALLMIIIDTIIGPILLTFSAIPGMTKLRKSWFNRLMKNALTFPVVLFIINLPILLKDDKLYFDFTPLSRGKFDYITTGGLIYGSIKLILPLVCYFAAAEIPKALNDFFPSEMGKGAQGFAQSTQARLSKVPGVSMLLGQGK